MNRDVTILRTALKDCLECLEGWMEIAENCDDRPYDHEAVAQAKAALEFTKEV